MYNFTTETIINSSVDSNGTLAKFSGGSGLFQVSRVGNFNATEVLSCYKNKYVAPRNEVLVRTIALTPVVGKVYRLSIKLKRQDSYTSAFANDMSFNALQKNYEVTATDTTAATLATAFYNSILRENRFTDNVYIIPTVNSAELTLTLVDNYTHFISAEIQLVDATNSPTGYDSYTVAENIFTLGTLTLGVEGFGTVKQITKNLRLPTLANTNWTAINQEEKPIAGGTYNQYSLRIKTARGAMGMGVVGQYVESITDHIFYVLTTLSAAFEAALIAASINITANSAQQVFTLGVTGDTTASVTINITAISPFILNASEITATSSVVGKATIGAITVNAPSGTPATQTASIALTKVATGATTISVTIDGVTYTQAVTIG